jgi:hypothetical protein
LHSIHPPLCVCCFARNTPTLVNYSMSCPALGD